MARHEISVNFFDSLLCSKRFRTFFFFAPKRNGNACLTQANFGHMSISCFAKSDRVMRLN